MDVFVFGIGCSGTTMIYSLMQSIFSQLYGDSYFSSYEPFIWDKDKFNGPYEKVSGLFGKTSSMSIATTCFVLKLTGDCVSARRIFSRNTNAIFLGSGTLIWQRFGGRKSSWSKRCEHKYPSTRSCLRFSLNWPKRSETMIPSVKAGVNEDNRVEVSIARCD